MSRHITGPRPDRRSFRAVSLRYLADEMGLSRDEARRAVAGLHHATWVGPYKSDPQTRPVVRHSPGVLPEAEDGIYKIGYHSEYR